MAESLDRTVTVCNVCASEMPEGATYGDPCGTGDGGVYSQHEDGLELEMRRIQVMVAKREALKLMNGGVSSENAYESLKSRGIGHDIILKGLNEAGYDPPAHVHEVSASEDTVVSDGPRAVKA